MPVLGSPGKWRKSKKRVVKDSDEIKSAGPHTFWSGLLYVQPLQHHPQLRGQPCANAPASFFANGLATLLSSTAQPITQARKADECWYEPTMSKTSVPIRT